MKSAAITLCLLSAAAVVITVFYAFRLETWSLWIAEEQPTCAKPSAIFFLKLHKCASSSVQNMFLRLGERLGMPMALPERGNYFGHPRHFRADMVHRPPGAANATYRMLLHHMRLDPDEVAKVVGPDAVWVTVMRRPVDQFISMFEYYNLQDVWNISLAEFAAAPADLMPAAALASHFFPNQMAFDLGFDAAALQADDRLQEDMLEAVRRRFGLVLVAELLDESLVLLRDRLCLDWDDVVAFRHNVRPPALRSPAGFNRTLRRQLRHHLAADGALYAMFHRRLREALREHGVAHVESGLVALRRRVLHWARRCRRWRWNWPGEPAPLPPPAPAGAARDTWMCSRLFAHELTYTDHVRRRQAERAARGRLLRLGAGGRSDG